MHSEVEIAQMWFAVVGFDKSLKGQKTDFHGLSDQVPGNEKELCAVLHIDQDTLVHWKKKSDFQLGVDAIYRKLLAKKFKEDAEEMYTVLTDMGKAGDPRSQKLWWDLYREFSPSIFMEHDEAALELRRKNVSPMSSDKEKLMRLLDLAPKKAHFEEVPFVEVPFDEPQDIVIYDEPEE